MNSILDSRLDSRLEKIAQKKFSVYIEIADKADYFNISRPSKMTEEEEDKWIEKTRDLSAAKEQQWLEYTALCADIAPSDGEFMGATRKQWQDALAKITDKRRSFEIAPWFRV